MESPYKSNIRVVESQLIGYMLYPIPSKVMVCPEMDMDGTYKVFPSIVTELLEVLIEATGM